MEVATSAIMDYTKTVGGKEVPVWDREEVDEIVISQVLCWNIELCCLRCSFQSIQSLLFLLAGFDTTATTLTNSAFLLARNPDVQDRLFKEIMEKHAKFVRFTIGTIFRHWILSKRVPNSAGRSESRNDSRFSLRGSRHSRGAAHVSTCH